MCPRVLHSTLACMLSHMLRLWAHMFAACWKVVHSCTLFSMHANVSACCSVQKVMCGR